MPSARSRKGGCLIPNQGPRGLGGVTRELTSEGQGGAAFPINLQRRKWRGVRGGGEVGRGRARCKCTEAGDFNKERTLL